MVLLPNLYVKLRAFLCDVLQYVSAQALVFLCTASGAQSPIASLWVPGFLILGKIPHFRSGNFAVPVRHFRMGTSYPRQ